MKITRELPAEWVTTRHGRVSSVMGKAYDGTCNIGGIARVTLVLFAGRGIYFFTGGRRHVQESTYEHGFCSAGAGGPAVLDGQ